MINRLLEKEIELVPDEGSLGILSPMKLEYYLTETCMDDMDELSGQKVYGIEIVKRVEGLSNEKNSVINLSCCKESTMGILDKLITNSVTPVGLPFILDDMLGE